MNPYIKHPNEKQLRNVLSLMGNSAAVPVGGGDGSGDAALPVLTAPQHEDGTTVRYWTVGKDPVDDSHYIIMPG